MLAKIEDAERDGMNRAPSKEIDGICEAVWTIVSRSPSQCCCGRYDVRMCKPEARTVKGYVGTPGRGALIRDQIRERRQTPAPGNAVSQSA